MSKVMNFLVSLPGIRTFFQANTGQKTLSAWNNFWLSAANATQKTMDLIPGKIDNVFLTPLKNSFIWLDPVVEKEIIDRKGIKKKITEIVGNPWLEGHVIRNLETGKIQKAKIELNTTKIKGFVYRLNQHRLSGKIRKLFGIKDNIPVVHGHKGRGEKDHLKIRLENINEELLRELDAIKNPKTLEKKFLQFFSSQEENA